MRLAEVDGGIMPATISVPTAGLVLGVGAASAYKAVAKGEIPVLRVGRRLLVPTARFRELLGCTDAELARQLAAITTNGSATS